MKKEELKNFTRDELEEMFVDLINKMETDGNRYMNEYAKDREKLEYYSYGGALLTKVKFINRSAKPIGLQPMGYKRQKN